MLSLAVALRQALTERLGIETAEVGYAVDTLPWEGEETPVAVLYDQAPGGAGFTPRAVELMPDLLARAAEILSCSTRDCDRACHACLLSFDTQWDADQLDRHKGLALLQALSPTKSPSP